MELFRFDTKSEPIASQSEFLGRVSVNILAALVLLALALGVGMYGYHTTERMSWLDAFLNAAMLIGGMGPVSDLHTDGGKLFAGVYAMVCGVVFVLASGVVLAPVIHRVLHSLHAEDSQ